MAVKRIASGQITIVDLNDGRAIQTYTVTSLGDSQIFSPDTKTYTPDYSATTQGVTAKILVTGESADQAPTAQCTNWVWKVNGAQVTSSTAGYTINNGYQLQIKTNIPSTSPLMNIEWSCDYTDQTTGAVTKVIGGKTINLTLSGGSAGMVVIMTPSGNTFDRGNAVTSLTAEAMLMKGSKIDITIQSAKWQRLDISTGSWVDVAAANVSITGGVSKLTVTADDVLNFQTFKCIIKDKLPDNTPGEEFQGLVTFFDATDPYVVEVYTLTGDKILNKTGSTTVYARVWLDNTLVEDSKVVSASAAKFDYKWTKYDNSGTASNWDGTSSNVKTGLSCLVKAEDVDKRATIACQVFTKS